MSDMPELKKTGNIDILLEIGETAKGIGNEVYNGRKFTEEDKRTLMDMVESLKIE